MADRRNRGRRRHVRPPRRRRHHAPTSRRSRPALACRCSVTTRSAIRPRADGAAARPYIVRPSVFSAQMRRARRRRATRRSPATSSSSISCAAAAARKPVLLTFDDASAGQYTNALPVLRRHRFKASFFIMTVVLGKPGLADPRAGARARPRGDGDRRAHVGPQAGPAIRGRGLGDRDHRADARSAAAGRPPDPPVRVPLRPLRREAIPHLFEPACARLSSSPTPGPRAIRCGRSGGSSSPSLGSGVAARDARRF